MSFLDSVTNLVPDLSSLKNNLGILSQAGANSAGLPPFPWMTIEYPDNNRSASFFTPISVDGTRWDQLFPYRLVVIDTANAGLVVGNSVLPKVTVQVGTSGTLVDFEPVNKWVFTLPITPEQLSIGDQYAILTTPTLKGLLEEHNGIVFKQINFNGTMGVWPFRQSVVHPPSTPSVLESVFGGTLSGIGNVIGQVQNTINTVTSNTTGTKPAQFGPELSQQGLASTGYYQALALQQFLEQYAIAKTDPKNAGWRLVIDIPKQNQSFVVSPIQFVWNQNKSRPMEVTYTLQLKAWRRIDLFQTPETIADSPFSISPGILQRVLNSISQARATAAAAINLIGAVRSDVDNVFNVLKQSSLLVKDLAGVVLTAADLPNQLIKDAKSTISDSLANVGVSDGNNSTDPTVKKALDLITQSKAQREGLSSDAVAGGQLGNVAANSLQIDPANNVFDDPNASFALFNIIPTSTLNLTNAQQTQVDNAVLAARNLTVADIKTFRSTIQELAIQLSNSFGTGDAYYNHVYNRPAPTSIGQEITLDQYDILNSFYDTLEAYDILTATTYLDQINKSTNMEYVAGLAADSGIVFATSTSKILAPVPFGLTIEAIAARYLNDPQRWLEIVTLNNLRDPYIDETGFQLPLLSNASGRQLTISDSSNLYIGQRVVLKSSTQVPTARSILGIDKLSDTSTLLTLDGVANLDNFLIADSAYIQAYLPGTVNSQQKIFIPSNLPIDNNMTVVAPASTLGDPLTGMSNVDLLLTDQGDLAINNYGDFRFAYGMTNIIQALKIKIGTQKGRWILHPEFGIGVTPGIINSTIAVQDIYTSINSLIIQDPRFTSVSKLQIQLNGPTMTISMAVTIAGQRGVFPIQFSVSASQAA